MLYREQTLANEMMPIILIKSDAMKIILLFQTRLYKQVRTLAREKPGLLIKKYFKYSCDNNSLQHKVSYYIFLLLLY